MQGDPINYLEGKLIHIYECMTQVVVYTKQNFLESQVMGLKEWYGSVVA